MRFPIARQASLAALLLAGVTLAAEPLTELERVVAVEVPVQVTVDGEPVRGLTADNFEVLVKGKKQQVVGFESVDLSALVPGPQGILTQRLAPAARRHILFLFDLTFAGPGSVIRARGAVEDVVRRLHPTDLAAVATYSTNQGPRIVLGFTSDRSQLLAAVRTLGVPDLVTGSIDPLGITLIEPRQMTFGSGAYDFEGITASGQSGRDFGIEDALAEHLASIQQEVSRTNQRAQQQQLIALTRDFANLAGLMNSVGGRKYVVYLSEGFDTSLMFASTDSAEVARMNQASASGQVWEVDPDARFGSNTSRSFMDGMLEEFRRANCVVQAIDIGAAKGQDDPRRGRSGTDGLFMMANETGGEFYRNYNKLEDALSLMLEKTSAYYALVIQPTDLEADGKYHKLKVKLKDAPKGAKLVHRPGFYAPKPFGERSARERQFLAADLVLGGGERGTLPVEVLATPFPAGGGQALVSVLVEVEGPALVGGQRGGTLPAEIYGYVLDAQGRVRDLFAGQFGIDLERFGDQLVGAGLKFYGDLSVAPGDYSLRVLVRNGATGDLRLRELPLAVPDGAPTGGLLLPPLLPDAAGRWLMVRETPRQGESPPPFPFTDQGETWVPGVAPVVVAGDTARMYLIGYGLGEELTMRASATGVADGASHELRIEGARRLSSAMPGADTLAAGLSTSGLGAGDYELSVVVRDEATGREQSSSIALKVVAPGRS